MGPKLLPQEREHGSALQPAGIPTNPRERTLLHPRTELALTKGKWGLQVVGMHTKNQQKTCKAEHTPYGKTAIIMYEERKKIQN